MYLTCHFAAGVPNTLPKLLTIDIRTSQCTRVYTEIWEWGDEWLPGGQCPLPPSNATLLWVYIPALITTVACMVVETDTIITLTY